MNKFKGKLLETVKQTNQRVVLWATAFVLALSPLLFNGIGVSAAATTSRKDVLSTSAPAVVANHTIQFVTPTGAGDASETITLTFDGSSGFTTVSAIDDTDVDIAFDTNNDCDAFSTEITVAPTADATNWGVASSGQVVTLTHSTDGANQDIPADRCVQIEIGTHATNEETGNEQITNPTKVAAAGTADISTIDIAGSFGDTGQMLVATIEGVSVSATVAESLSFTIADDDTCTPGGTGTVVGANVDSIPFGTPTTETFYKGCQILTVGTNASDGYAITAEANTSLLSGAGDTIDDTTCEGACTQVIGAGTTTAWTTATNNGLGYTCNSGGCSSEFNSASEFNQFPCRGSDAQCDGGTGNEAIQTPISSATPQSSQASTIVYKLSVDSAQAAGTYSNTIRYIATPTF